MRLENVTVFFSPCGFQNNRGEWDALTKTLVNLDCLHPPFSRRNFTSNKYFLQGGTTVKNKNATFFFLFENYKKKINWKKFNFQIQRKWIFYRSPTLKKIFIPCKFPSRETGVRTIKSDRCHMRVTSKSIEPLLRFFVRASLSRVLFREPSTKTFDVENRKKQ